MSVPGHMPIRIKMSFAHLTSQAMNSAVFPRARAKNTPECRPTAVERVRFDIPRVCLQSALCIECAMVYWLLTAGRLETQRGICWTVQDDISIMLGSNNAFSSSSDVRKRCAFLSSPDAGRPRLGAPCLLFCLPARLDTTARTLLHNRRHTIWLRLFVWQN